MAEKISSIFRNNYYAEIPWSQRVLNGNRSKLINKIRGILELFSGFESTNLIRDLIKPNEMKLVAEKYYQGLKI